MRKYVLREMRQPFPFRGPVPTRHHTRHINQHPTPTHQTFWCSAQGASRHCLMSDRASASFPSPISFSTSASTLFCLLLFFQ